jgi:hypothetical protein
MHFHLESWTQANVRFDCGLGFTLKPRKVFCGQLCDGAYLAAFVALRRVNVASAELRKEKTVRVLHGLAMAFFCSSVPSWRPHAAMALSPRSPHIMAQHARASIADKG